MTQFDVRTDFAPALRTITIITVAMTAGVALFLVVVFFVPAGTIQPVNPNLPVITYVAGAVCLAGAAARFFVPTIIIVGARRRIAQGGQLSGRGPGKALVDDATRKRVGPAADWMGVYVTSTILAAALIEGPALVAVVAYMIERQFLALILAVFMIVALAMHIPTADRVQSWIERQLRDSGV